MLSDFNHPVGIVTKNHLVTRDIDILADMARIATRQASSALLSSLVGAATSYFTGGGGGNGLAAGSAGA